MVASQMLTVPSSVHAGRMIRVVAGRLAEVAEVMVSNDLSELVALHGTGSGETATAPPAAG
ncbi:hypothetical protein ACFVTC_28990 [Streptomyces sp. NPDC057950]|uniref:hypothetical protein n=1 Tax=Streptomyces sp. NPDC057950 TaxID=3346288 RepID=UPI0036E8EDA3